MTLGGNSVNRRLQGSQVLVQAIGSGINLKIRLQFGATGFGRFEHQQVDQGNRQYTGQRHNCCLGTGHGTQALQATPPGFPALLLPLAGRLPAL